MSEVSLLLDLRKIVLSCNSGKYFFLYFSYRVFGTEDDVCNIRNDHPTIIIMISRKRVPWRVYIGHVSRSYISICLQVLILISHPSPQPSSDHITLSWDFPVLITNITITYYSEWIKIVSPPEFRMINPSQTTIWSQCRWMMEIL